MIRSSLDESRSFHLTSDHKTSWYYTTNEMTSSNTIARALLGSFYQLKDLKLT